MDGFVGGWWVAGLIMTNANVSKAELAARSGLEITVYLGILVTRKFLGSQKILTEFTAIVTAQQQPQPQQQNNHNCSWVETK